MIKIIYHKIIYWYLNMEFIIYNYFLKNTFIKYFTVYENFLIKIEIWE